MTVDGLYIYEMVIPEGLEPPTYRLGICRSILMSYGTTRGSL